MGLILPEISLAKVKVVLLTIIIVHLVHDATHAHKDCLLNYPGLLIHRSAILEMNLNAVSTERQFDRNYTPVSRGTVTFSERNSPTEGYISPAPKNPRMEQDDKWKDAFSIEKGYPGFCAGFANDLTEMMSEKLVPKFSHECAALIKSQVDPVKKDLNTVNQKVDATMAEVCMLRSKVFYAKTVAQEAKDLALKVDAQQRMNNLIFSGIPETPNEKASECLRKILDEICKVEGVLEEEVNIQTCYRVGKRSFYKPRDILVKFLDYTYKQAISKGRDSLSTEVKVRQDLPSELACLNRALMPVKNVACAMPKYRNNCFVSLGELKFRLDSGEYLVITLRNLDDIPKDIHY